jgi:hypothetical protein
MYAELLSWLEQHDKLAGWAQFLGVIIAVAIAVLVPWWQMRGIRRQERLRFLEEDLICTRGEFFLISDLCAWVGNLIQADTLPRKQLRSDSFKADVLDRLREWESREVREERALWLFNARNEVHRIAVHVEIPFMSEQKWDSRELEMLRAEQSRLLEIQSSARAALQPAAEALALARAPWMFRSLIRQVWRSRKKRAAIQPGAGPANG